MSHSSPATSASATSASVSSASSSASASASSAGGSDRVRVRRLALRTIIGINPEERTNLQDVTIDIDVTCDCRDAARTESIEQAVNYRTISKRVIALVEGNAFFLVETMAERIARLALADPRAEAVRVEVLKPSAVRFADAVGVEVFRQATEYDADDLAREAAAIDEQIAAARQAVKDNATFYEASDG